MPDASPDAGLRSLVAARVKPPLVRPGGAAGLARYDFLGGEAIEWGGNGDVKLPATAKHS
jgi:hypothetical protein